MWNASLPLNEYADLKVSRQIARLLSPGPAFGLHSCSSSQRGQVEQYIFEQFQAYYGATVCDFLPWLLTTTCNGKYAASVGIRPAREDTLFLEQYLPKPIEKVLGKFTHQRVRREQVVEIGNLVATRRGSSQLMFLILAPVLQRAGFEWFVCTVTPQVKKTIRYMGLKLSVLGDADPEAINTGSLSAWGSYYEGRPVVVAGNLSDAMALGARRKIYSYLISFYQDRIDALALMIKQNSSRNGQHSFTT